MKTHFTVRAWRNTSYGTEKASPLVLHWRTNCGDTPAQQCASYKLLRIRVSVLYHKLINRNDWIPGSLQRQIKTPGQDVPKGVGEWSAL